MADLPVERLNTPPAKEQKIQITESNAPILAVQYLAHIYSRLGYIVKLLEDK